MKCPSCQADNLSDSRFCHRCATPLGKDLTKSETRTSTFQTPRSDLSRGDVFADRYEILEDLGQGGMGKVYKAFDHKIKEVVALKLIKPEIGLNEKAIERFRNELKFARKISHKNVCRMYDMGEEGFFHFITMEYVEGEDLKRFIRRAGQLTPTKSLAIAIQICEGLGEAHRLGVVHRDLKPQNIMIDKDGNARIMDFGIARFLEAEGVTGSGVMIGTPEYMSPEQAEVKEVDQRSDIYSLGVILYEMVSGHVPFEGATPLSVAMKHKMEKPIDIRAIRPHISPDAAALISKCLEKDPVHRYQNTEDLLADLKKIEKGAPAVEKETPTKELAATKQATVTVRSKRWHKPAAAVTVLAAAAILVWQLAPKRKATGEASRESAQISADSQTRGIEPLQEEPAKKKQGADEVAAKPVDKATAAESKEKPKPALTQKSLETTPKKEEKKAAALPKAKEGSSQAVQTPPPAEPPKPLLTESEGRSLQLSKARVSAAKSVALSKGPDTRNLLFRMAVEQELASEAAIGNNDFLEAKALFNNLEVLYRLASKSKTVQDCAKSLQGMVEDLRKKAEKGSLSDFDPDLYKSGRQKEDEAAGFYKKKEYEKAAKAYWESGVIYQKISLKSLSSAR